MVYETQKRNAYYMISYPPSGLVVGSGHRVSVGVSQVAHTMVFLICDFH